MYFTKQISKLFIIVTVFSSLVFSACQSGPKNDLDQNDAAKNQVQVEARTSIESIDALKNQVQIDAKLMNELQNYDFAQLQKSFVTCDSMLQYLHPETIDEMFEQLQLVGAYLAQFKATHPLMQADMDSTMIQLDNLKSDIESHFLTDSLAAVYLEAETQHVDMINNQVKYFKERLESCQKDLDELKEKL